MRRPALVWAGRRSTQTSDERREETPGKRRRNDEQRQAADDDREIDPPRQQYPVSRDDGLAVPVELPALVDAERALQAVAEFHFVQLVNVAHRDTPGWWTPRYH